MGSSTTSALARACPFAVALLAAALAAACSAEGTNEGRTAGGATGGTGQGAAGASGWQATAGAGAEAGAGGAAGAMAGSGGSDGAVTGGNGAGAGSGGEPSGGTGGDSCAGVQERAEARLLPSDVIWAIDTSGSMTASFPSIQQALNDFSSRVIAAGVDARIILLAGSGLCVPLPLGSGQCGPALAGSPALDTREPEFLHLDLPFGWSQGMSVILDNHPLYSHLLRPDSHVQFVLTEDGPPPMTSADVVDRIEGRGLNPWNPPLAPGSWTFNGIVCMNGMGVGTCLISMAVPTTTLELIQNTSGIVADLDLAGQPGADPFADLLDKLATAVIVGARISCEYAIPPPPPGETFDRDRVNVVYTDGQGGQVTYPMVPAHLGCEDKQGWKYDDEAQPGKVVLCPAACEAVQQDLEAQISVEFGCETLVLLE